MEINFVISNYVDITTMFIDNIEIEDSDKEIDHMYDSHIPTQEELKLFKRFLE